MHHRPTPRRRASSRAIFLLAPLAIAACAEPTITAPATTPGVSLAATMDVPPVAWRPVRGPLAIGALAVAPSGAIFAGDDVDGLWRSDDEGASWGKVATFPAEVGVNDIAVEASGVIWAATSAGVVRSHDGGTSWVPAGLADRWVTKVAVGPDGIAYAGAGGWTGGVFATSDEGRNWRQVIPSVNPRDFILTFLEVHKSDLFLGTHSDHLFRAWNLGERWEMVTSLLEVENYSPSPNAMVVTDDAMLVALPLGIVRSDDDARSWSVVLKETGVLEMTRAADGAILALGSDGRMYRSTDTGRSWSMASIPLPARDIARAFVATPSGRAIVGTYEGVWVSVR